MWRDPFRKRFVFSIKGYNAAMNDVFGRHRLYWESPDFDPFGAGVAWGAADPVVWAAADTLDQPAVPAAPLGPPTNTPPAPRPDIAAAQKHAELYTLDVSPCKYFLGGF